MRVLNKFYVLLRKRSHLRWRRSFVVVVDRLVLVLVVVVGVFVIMPLNERTLYLQSISSDRRWTVTCAAAAAAQRKASKRFEAFVVLLNWHYESGLTVLCSVTDQLFSRQPHEEEFQIEYRRNFECKDERNARSVVQLNAFLLLFQRNFLTLPSSHDDEAQLCLSFSVFLDKISSHELDFSAHSVILMLFRLSFEIYSPRCESIMKVKCFMKFNFKVLTSVLCTQIFWWNAKRNS